MIKEAVTLISGKVNERTDTWKEFDVYFTHFEWKIGFKAWQVPSVYLGVNWWLQRGRQTEWIPDGVIKS